MTATLNRVFEAIYSIPDWLDDSDLSGVEAALDVLATEMIRAELVNRRRVLRAHARHLSDVLRISAENDDSTNLAQAIDYALAIEECIAAHQYGQYSEETIKDADTAIEALIACLEAWLEKRTTGNE